MVTRKTNYIETEEVNQEGNSPKDLKICLETH